MPLGQLPVEKLEWMENPEQTQVLGDSLYLTVSLKTPRDFPGETCWDREVQVDLLSLLPPLPPEDKPKWGKKKDFMLK